MKKNLELEMEEECIDCPMLDLETHTLYADNNAFFKVHNCSHIEFCKAVRKNWEQYHKKEEEGE